MTNKEAARLLVIHRTCLNEYQGIYKEALTVAIKALRNQPRWIPCRERLPEYGIEVVSVDKDGEYEINHIIDEEDGEWFWQKVTAWMPLPEPYKGGKE